jgi:uncharacterized RDD family membrane protein YckC/phage FluMu protein Com
MPIVFQCSGCNRQLRAKEEAAGRKARCPQCGTITEIPSPSPARHAWDDDDEGPPEYGLAGAPKPAAAPAPPLPTATRPCPYCGEPIPAGASECEYCGEALEPPVGAPRPRRRRRRRRREPAGFWLRFVAYFLDSLIVGAAMCVVAIPFGVLAGLQGQPGGAGPNQMGGADAAVNLINIIVTWLYFAFQESSSAQATLGKRAVGIIVTDMDGNPISFGRATGRHFGKIVSGCLCLAGYIMAAFTEHKQALHDMMAGTLVVRK